METPLEDTNLESEVLYTMNIDTQEVNVVVDKETTEDKKKDVTTESLTTDVEINVSTNIEKPTEDSTEKQSEKPEMNSAEANTHKPKVHSEATSEKPIVESSEKPSEALEHKQVDVQVQTKKHKPLLIEMHTQTDPPEKEESKVITTIGIMEIVKIAGQTSSTSIAEFRLTNVTEVLLDSIKKIIECSAQSYKAIDDTIPILKLIAPKCIVNN